MSGPPLSVQITVIAAMRDMARRLAQGETLKPEGRVSERQWRVEMLDRCLATLKFLERHEAPIRAFCALPEDVRGAILSASEEEIRSRFGLWQPDVPAQEPGAGDAAGTAGQGGAA